MKRFIKFCLLLSLPIIIMIVFYITMDPFRVIKNYEVYYTPDNFVGLNRGFVSAMHYKNHYKEYKYNSFIFGNSRSIAYYEDEWKKYIPESSVCYHFDNSGGCVGDLYYQIKYINEHGDIWNALVILDSNTLSSTEGTGILWSCPPILKKNKGVIEFHNEVFTSFYSIEFFHCFVDYKIHKKYKPYMEYYIQNPEKAMDYNPKSNELRWDNQEESIANGLYYNDTKIKEFSNAQFPGKVSVSVLNDERKNMLREIKAVFELQKTNYRIIISPVFDQIKINPDDLHFLTDLFGQDYVFDFSGPNQWNANYQNYYETSHYRPCVANDIMEIVYSHDIQY